MDTQTPEQQREAASQELAQRMAGKTQVEQANMLKDFMSKENVHSEERNLGLLVSDEQLDKVLRHLAEGSKKAIEEEAAKLNRTTGLTINESTAIVEDEVSKKIKRNSQRTEDLKQVAESFRTIAKAASGRAEPGALKAAYEKDRDYLQRSGRLVRGNTLDVGTGSDGGYLSPETWDTLIYENLARVSLMRRFAHWFEMPHNIYRLPKITTNVTAATVTEGAAFGNGSKPTINQATWELGKISCMTTPFSIELLENADPNLIDIMTQIVTVEMNRKEDEICFNTNDSGWSPILTNAYSGNTVYLGGNSTSGSTSQAQTTLDDMTNLMYALAEQYIPDDDVSGSNLVSGEAQYWINQSLLATLLNLKGAVSGSTVGYLLNPVQQDGQGVNIRGKRVRRVLSMPSAATSPSTKFAAFGNLGYQWVGFKPGFTIDILREGTVLDAAGSSVSLAQTSQYALRVNELLATQIIDNKAFSVLETSAS